jgi:hypothetical protein
MWVDTGTLWHQPLAAVTKPLDHVFTELATIAKVTRPFVAQGRVHRSFVAERLS